MNRHSRQVRPAEPHALGTLVNISAARTHLSRLVRWVEAGEEMVLARRGQAVARMIPYVRAPRQRRLGIWKGKVWTAEDWDSSETNAEAARGFDQ